MCNIGTQCNRENVSLGPPSRGQIANTESVIRVVYDPLHLNPKKTRIKAGVIRESDLLTGQLSVWRTSPTDPENLAETKSYLTATKPEGQEIRHFVSIWVGEIRRMTGLDGQRLFCVRDDTRIDEIGGRHAEHATISFCALKGEPYKDSTSNEFIFARDLLHAALLNAISDGDV
ncbi:hypothetical protein [Asticcacaulis sp.]|uniref:hypothetical protein n=1 Tax=Asticcacaulis sp. TaxID=1872648 RepID=UPI0031D01E83